MFAQEISRRTFVAMGASALAMGLFACSKNTAPEEVDAATGTATEETQDAEGGQLLGGWEVNEDVPANALTSDESETFDQAMQGYVGMSLTPVCVLATQVVSGTNLAYLCQGAPVAPNAQPGWYVAVVYKDLEGACKMSGVEEIVVSEPATADETVPQGLTGGWSVAPQVTDDALIVPDEAGAAFVAGAEKHLGVALRPLALLGTQLVSGTNYRLICVGAPATLDPNTQLYVVDVYQNLEGEAEFTAVEAFDLLAYV